MWKRCRARFRKWAAALASVSHCSGMSCRNCKLCDRQSGTRSRRMQACNSTLKIPVIFLFALVGLNYWPVFFGKVPLPTDIIIQFPPFQDYQNEATMNHQHAELGDTVTQFYIWRKFQGEAIRHGVLPLWNPHLLAGTPFQANTLSALFYPFNLLFVLLPMPVAWSLSVMLKIFLSGLFTVLFLHAIGASTSGSIAGGLAFAFGGFMTGWSGWPQTETALWLPFMCYCTLRVCQKPSVRNAVLTAVAFAMPLLAGHPGLAAHVVLAAASYGIWVVAWTRSPDCRRQLPCLLAGGLLALGLAAVQ